MKYPNAKQTLSQYQPYIRAAHEARSEEVHHLFGKLGRGIGNTIAALFSPLHRASRWFARLLSARAALRELEAMDDRMLADLGISREEIGKVVRNGKPEREPSAEPEKHPHEAKRAAEVVELYKERDLASALILHGPWGRYANSGGKRHDAA